MSIRPAEANLRLLCQQAGVAYVPLRGNTASRCVVIGEAPGEQEEREGKPFVGASGKLLTGTLREVGLSEADYWITNVLKVRPPNNELSRLGELKIPGCEAACHQALLEELSDYKPAIIIACGALALAFLCPFTIDPKTKSPSMEKWRCSLLRSDRLSWDHYVIPVPHPAFILRMWAEKPIMTFCLARAAEELAWLRQHGVLQPLPERKLLWNLCPQDACDWVSDCIRQDDPVSMDIELSGKRIGNKNYYFGPDMIALAKSPWASASIELFKYDDVNNVKLWRLLDTLLAEQRIIGQNEIGFDAQQLRRIGFEPCVSKWLDTMVLHHSTRWIEMPHGLNFLAMIYTRQPYFKDDAQLWKSGSPMDAKMRYNALDAAVTYEVAIRLLEEIAEGSGWIDETNRVFSIPPTISQGFF